MSDSNRTLVGRALLLHLVDQPGICCWRCNLRRDTRDSGQFSIVKSQSAYCTRILTLALVQALALGPVPAQVYQEPELAYQGLELEFLVLEFQGRVLQVAARLQLEARPLLASTSDC